MSLLDPETLQERARINTGSHPNEMAWDRDRLFVANSGSNSISVIDDGKVVETIKTSLDPQGAGGFDAGRADDFSRPQTAVCGQCG